MNRNDEPVTVVPDVEDNITGHIVGIGKVCSQLLKVSPSCRLHNPHPGTNFLSSFAMILRRLLQAFDGHNVHGSSLLRNLRSVNQAEDFD